MKATLPKDAENYRQEAVQALHERLERDCQVSAIHETGHVLHWQKPEEVIALVEQWLTVQTNKKKYGIPRLKGVTVFAVLGD